MATIQKGEVLSGSVQQVTADGLWVQIAHNIRGRVFLLEISDDLSVLSNVLTLPLLRRTIMLYSYYMYFSPPPLRFYCLLTREKVKTNFQPGHVVRVRVLAVDPEKDLLDLSIKAVGKEKAFAIQFAQFASFLSLTRIAAGDTRIAEAGPDTARSRGEGDRRHRPERAALQPHVRSRLHH
jgi:predicted RNA-binding protein with RPS1 domain